MRLSRILSISGREAGISLIETLVAICVLGIIAVTFLTGVTLTSKAAAIMDEQATAVSLARRQMELVQSANYSVNGYFPAPIPSGKDYTSYTVNVTAARLHATEDGIQTITVSVIHSGKQVITLGSYKVNR